MLVRLLVVSIYDEDIKDKKLNAQDGGLDGDISSASVTDRHLASARKGTGGH